MFVLTIDQVDSRNGRDLVPAAVEQAASLAGAQLAIPPQRLAGDEFQVITANADAALAIALALARTANWSIGIGIGAVEAPLPRDAREARGEAILLARDAVTAAKDPKTHRVVVRIAEGRTLDSGTLQAVLDLLLDLRAGRSERGWQVADLRESGLIQRQIADQLRITPQSVSEHVAAARLDLDARARRALARLFQLVGVE